MNVFIVVVLIVYAQSGSTAKLPSYMKKCSLKDKEISDCIKSNVPILKPYFKKGIKELNIPPLAPFHIDRLSINAGNNLKINMTNLDIFYLDEFDYAKVVVDGATYKAENTFRFDRLEITGTYDIDGQILILPIKGHGPANITIDQFELDYDFYFIPTEKNGDLYFEFRDQKFDFRLGHIKLQLDNLFNGDKVLGDNLNAFLNENWRDVEELLRPAVSETVLAFVGAIFERVVEKLSVSDLFD